MTDAERRAAILAWRLHVHGFTPSIAFAASAPKARYMAFAGIKEAGFSASFASIRSERAPAFDGMECWGGRRVGVCYTEDELLPHD